MSKAFSLSKLDYKKIARGLLIALAGAALTYFSSLVTNTDFGPIWTPLIMAGWSGFANALRLYLTTSNSY